MNWWLPHTFSGKIPHLDTRRRMLGATRQWLETQGFWEVETPALQVMPTADVHIHGFQTALWGRDLQPARDYYLHTSPEFAMKKLLVAGLPQIYQICRVFRNAEISPLHAPEFTLLEWYRTGTGYKTIMEDCVQLFRHIARTLDIRGFRHKDKASDPFKDWNYITVAEAFKHYMDLDLSEFLDDRDGFSAALAEKGIRTAPSDAWDDLFFAAMAERIEPYLGMDAPCILYEYPASMAALARKKPGDPRWAERFELYVCGLELANAFDELTDAGEQAERFRADMAEKQRIYGYTYPVDEEFIKALEHGMPACSGIALGMDRLAMLCSGADHIDQVLWTPPPR